ncbi:MAG: hypothetical protein ACK47E_11170 [Cyclobacteriaceae bacterium]|jgi:biotin-(acetyl-CoA carboxylase) ligase
MKTTDIRQKLHHYIETAKDKKVKAIYAMVEDEIQETYDHWNDEEFLSELRRRQESYTSGKAKTYTLSETMSEIKQAIKRVNKKGE